VQSGEKPEETDDAKPRTPAPISHEFILKTLGTTPGREWVKRWLKAGYVEASNIHIQHVKEVAKGGTDEEGNLKLVHATCHKQIHGRNAKRSRELEPYDG
jgi:hypothetical protein